MFATKLKVYPAKGKEYGAMLWGPRKCPKPSKPYTKDNMQMNATGAGYRRDSHVQAAPTYCAAHARSTAENAARTYVEAAFFRTHVWMNSTPKKKKILWSPKHKIKKG